MQFAQLLVSSLATAGVALSAKATACPPFPTSMIVFGAGFQEPVPPLVKDEYKANFVQHKWNENLTHITTGFITNSPSKKLVSVGEAFEGVIATSIFNYSNVTKDGLVDNIMTTYNGSSTKPDVFRGYVNSGFPIFQADMLRQNEATFTGLVERQFTQGQVASWSIMYQGALPVTVFVNSCNVVVGYDFFSPVLRTRAVTEYFNIQV